MGKLMCDALPYKRPVRLSPMPSARRSISRPLEYRLWISSGARGGRKESQGNLAGSGALIMGRLKLFAIRFFRSHLPRLVFLDLASFVLCVPRRQRHTLVVLKHIPGSRKWSEHYWGLGRTAATWQVSKRVVCGQFPLSLRPTVLTTDLAWTVGSRYCIMAARRP
jgi:hypothetical protein